MRDDSSRRSPFLPLSIFLFVGADCPRLETSPCNYVGEDVVFFFTFLDSLFSLSPFVLLEYFHTDRLFFFSAFLFSGIQGLSSCS